MSGTATISQAMMPVHRFTAAEYLHMIDTGVLGSSDHVELIEGMIVDMSPSGPKHHHVLMRLTRLFSPALPFVELSIQGTLVLSDDHVLDPDFMLLRPREGGYKSALPTAADVLLLIEASDTSLRKDREVKLPRYAAAGVPEYWIADLERETITVHREPAGDRYNKIVTLVASQTISPLALPQFAFPVAELYA